MLTVIGTAVLCSSFLGFGFSYTSSLKTERESLRELLALMKRIKTRTECFRQPLSDIYAGFASVHLENMGFIHDLNESGLSFALSKHRRALMIREEIFASLSEFAASLGKSYIDEQLRLCSLYIEKTEECLISLNTELTSKSKLAMTLSCAAAGMSAIMFL